MKIFAVAFRENQSEREKLSKSTREKPKVCVKIFEKFLREMWLPYVKKN